MKPLDIKMLRDLRRLWAQTLAIALVLAAGTATLILGVGTYTTLNQTRAHYYASHHFADLFVELVRAPKDMLPELAAIDGVAALEPRIVKLALANLADTQESISLMLVSLPLSGRQTLNHLALREGRLPEAGSDTEIALNESFAVVHKLKPGARIALLVNGVRREFVVTGLALSPEYVLAMGPGQLTPDERRFGVGWLPEQTLATAYGLQGAFSNLAVQLETNANANLVIAKLDAALDRYGSQGAYGRKYQMSHAFLDSELNQLKAMSYALPPTFLLVAAFLVNMTLTRLIALEREQIGLLKALGYSSAAVALHYMKFVAAIALIGSLIGIALGFWMGDNLSRLYGRFYHFPELVFSRDLWPSALAVGLTMAAAALGALRAALEASVLLPAIAMAPPSPVRYQSFFKHPPRLVTLMHQTTLMTIRHLVHWPWRTLGGIVGVSAAVSVLVASLWPFGSVQFMLEANYGRMEREQAVVTFPTIRPAAALFDIAHFPGIIRAEPFRSLGAEISFGTAKRRTSLIGKSNDAQLSRLVDIGLKPITLPDQGLVISNSLADLIGVGPGDVVTVKLLDGNRQSHQVKVSSVVTGFFGTAAYMDISALNRLLGEGGAISGANISFDTAQNSALLAELKKYPATQFSTFLRLERRNFEKMLNENLLTMITIYLSMASIIAFGVIYNYARVSLSEQGRDMASLRVLGFTRGEVASLMFTELCIIVLAAQPLGWLMGYGIARAMASSFSTELYSMPLIIGPNIYAIASVANILAAVVSAVLVRQRIDRLDMVEVLKTRE
jgi:putative ABC transport system permease protein